MANRDLKKRKLSKSILEMKFMKKSKIKADEDKEAEEGSAMFADARTKEMKHGESQFIMESSFIPCENLIVGRLSFQGMNLDVERLMEENGEDERKALELANEADVTDLEMAKAYALTGAVGRKFKTKRAARLDIESEEAMSTGTKSVPDRKKLKFLKPVD